MVFFAERILLNRELRADPFYLISPEKRNSDAPFMYSNFSSHSSLFNVYFVISQKVYARSKNVFCLQTTKRIKIKKVSVN